MGKWSKLYRSISADRAPPRLSFQDFLGLVAAAGFELKRRRGSHRSYRHPAIPEVLTVQPKGKDAQPYQIRLFLDMMRRHKLGIED